MLPKNFPSVMDFPTWEYGGVDSPLPAGRKCFQVLVFLKMLRFLAVKKCVNKKNQ